MPRQCKMMLIMLLAFLFIAPAAKAASADKLVNKLSVKSEKNNGYDRDLFNHWIDANNNGCDTRDEVLRRQDKTGNRVCDASEGQWYSAYDGITLYKSSELDVDHFVPLAEAWGSGARQWRAKTRTQFANDMYGYSLLAVSASSNRSKSDSDPREWMPPKTSFACTYVARWIAVKYRWRLSIDRQEKRSLRQTMDECSKNSLKVTKIKRAKILKKKPGGGGSNLDPRFPSCSAAIAAGYGPYYRDRDPEYEWYRDADGDGVVCE